MNNISLSENSNSQRVYTIFNVIRPALSVDGALELMKSIIVLKDPNDKILHQNISMRNFAFKIDRNLQGHYIVTEIQTSVEQIQKIRGKMEINENFLRTMIISNDPKFQINEDYIKKLSYSTTKRGRILFQKQFNRQLKAQIANHIKRFRYLGILPYVNYNC